MDTATNILTYFERRLSTVFVILIIHNPKPAFTHIEHFLCIILNGIFKNHAVFVYTVQSILNSLVMGKSVFSASLLKSCIKHFILFQTF